MNKHNKGQVLLLVLLVTSVILVVAMSVVSRSISDILTSTQEEESVRALSAAEAGLEQALSSPTIGNIPETVVSIAEKESSYQTTVASFGADTKYEYPKNLESGETASIWLIGHDDSNNLDASAGSYTNNNLDICWGKQLPGNQPNSNPLYPAIEVMVIYENSSGQILSTTAGFDANDSRKDSNKFADVSSSNRNGVSYCKNGDNEYTMRATLNFSNMGVSNYSSSGALKVVIVRMLYGNEAHPLEVITNGGLPLPSQGRKIDSVGTAGDSTRKVEVSLLYADAPAPFTAAIASKGSIVK